MKLLVSMFHEERKAEIYTDGGGYYLHLIEGDVVQIKPYNEHTLKIVEKHAKEWIENESNTN